jgi:hypothetical protein
MSIILYYMKYWESITFPRKGTIHDILNFNVSLTVYCILYLCYVNKIIIENFNMNLSNYYLVIGLLFLMFKHEKIMNDLFLFTLSLSLISSYYVVNINLDKYGLLFLMIGYGLTKYSYFRNKIVFLFIGLYILSVLSIMNYQVIFYYLFIELFDNLFCKYVINNYLNYNEIYIVKECKNIVGMQYYTNYKMHLHNLCNMIYNNNLNIYPQHHTCLFEKKKKTFKIIKQIGMNNYKLLIIAKIFFVIILTFTFTHLKMSD